MRDVYLCALGVLALGCSSCGAARENEPSPVPSAPSPPTYEVHEWGLVRGTVNDRVMLSGPYAEPPAMAVAKPILYFHRIGQGALVVDVEARIVHGSIVEHWPTPGGEPGPHVLWRGVTIGEGNCHGSRYPGYDEDPCSRVTDGCEAATLAAVETSDSSCLSWPGAEQYNHLFYRGEVNGAPPLPLRVEMQPDGSLRVTSRTREPIPGRFIRVLRSNGMPGVTDGVTVVAPPAPGQSIVVPPPSAAMTTGVNALTESLRAAGLSEPEVEAFHRAWDVPIFGAAPCASDLPCASRVAAATPMAEARPLASSRSILYVLPLSAADALATLSFTPAPTTVRRAIAAWIDESASP